MRMFKMECNKIYSMNVIYVVVSNAIGNLSLSKKHFMKILIRKIVADPENLLDFKTFDLIDVNRYFSK